MRRQKKVTVERSLNYVVAEQRHTEREDKVEQKAVEVCHKDEDSRSKHLRTTDQKKHVPGNSHFGRLQRQVNFNNTLLLAPYPLPLTPYSLLLTPV